ncbi:MAG TPA: bifunctional tetrahydrofolate synthase/dihydrofolate synthase, partial [Enterobacteriaceae bacterium]|nr:bifunctional tetrahydrofolate synthase/dihydrofolate synthase [Enterobacteriaceae bacterium]
MEMKSTPQATSPLATWLSYLENLHGKTIDMGLERVSRVAAALDVLKPAPFVFTVAGTNGKGT